MQVTRPNEIRTPGVRLHPKACAALGLEAERATTKHPRTQVPKTCMHALGTGYARKSGEPLGFRPKERTCASTGAHPPGRTSSHAGGDQPSRCCPGRFVGGHQSGLAGSKPPPLFTRGTTGREPRQGEPWGASPRPSAPTYLPTYVRSERRFISLLNNPDSTPPYLVKLPFIGGYLLWSVVCPDIFLGIVGQSCFRMHRLCRRHRKRLRAFLEVPNVGRPPLKRGAEHPQRMFRMTKMSGERGSLDRRTDVWQMLVHTYGVRQPLSCADSPNRSKPKAVRSATYTVP